MARRFRIRLNIMMQRCGLQLFKQSDVSRYLYPNHNRIAILSCYCRNPTFYYVGIGLRLTHLESPVDFFAGRRWRGTAVLDVVGTFVPTIYSQDHETGAVIRVISILCIIILQYNTLSYRRFYCFISHYIAVYCMIVNL